MSSTAAMTLAAFRQTGRDVADLATLEGTEGYEGTPGRAYLGDLWIAVETASDSPRYVLILGNRQFDSDSLNVLEARLYEYAASEDFFPKQTDDQLREIGASAKPVDDDDYGSNENIAKQNVFFILFEQAGYNGDEFEAMKATPDELIDLALAKLGKPSPGKPRSRGRCLDEFPSFPASAFPPIPDGFEDVSWRNDACPSIANEALNLQVYIDFPDVADRDVPEACGRFTVLNYIESDHLLTTDDWQDVLAFIAKRDASSGELEMSTIGKIATKFAQLLKLQLSPAEFAEMKAKNEDPKQFPGVCASHDYLDANIVMADAFETVMGRGLMLDGHPQFEADCKLWGAAWNLARALYIGERA